MIGDLCVDCHMCAVWGTLHCATCAACGVHLTATRDSPHPAHLSCMSRPQVVEYQAKRAVRIAVTAITVLIGKRSERLETLPHVASCTWVICSLCSCASLSSKTILTVGVHTRSQEIPAAPASTEAVVLEPKVPDALFLDAGSPAEDSASRSEATASREPGSPGRRYHPHAAVGNRSVCVVCSKSILLPCSRPPSPCSW